MPKVVRQQQFLCDPLARMFRLLCAQPYKSSTKYGALSNEASTPTLTAGLAATVTGSICKLLMSSSSSAGSHHRIATVDGYRSIQIIVASEAVRSSMFSMLRFGCQTERGLFVNLRPRKGREAFGVESKDNTYPDVELRGFGEMTVTS
jgi:hypothetical protein